jgi:chromosome segregation ATPase
MKMTDDPLPNLISAAEACVASAKGSLDAVVSRLRAIETDGVKCDANLAAKWAASEEQINRLRADIQHHQAEKAKAIREREIAEGERDKVRKDIERLKAEYLRIFDRVQTTAA